MSKINVSELDFATLKDSLKSFLRGKSGFTDFDYDGSGMAFLLDLLAANSTLQAFQVHMAANEAFLDSAVLRQSVISRAKTLGYVPRSRRAPVAILRLQCFPASSPATIPVAQGTKFTSKIDGKVYTFETLQAYTILQDGSDYIIENVEIYEGTTLRQTFTVDLTAKQRYVIPNIGVDTTTLVVKVQKSATNTQINLHTLYEDINVLDEDSLVYYLNECEDFKHEISFGDGVIGKALEQGNIITIDYRTCNGAAANGARNFELASAIPIATSTTWTVTQAASSGTDEESIDSIKYLAPLNYQAQNRAVTRQDYESLILRDYPNIDACRVWGGEDNDPPDYGRVYVSLKPKDGFSLSQTTKLTIAEEIIKPKNPVAIDIKFTDPDYLFITVKSNVKYTSATTALSNAAIQQLVTAKIKEFATTELNKFGSYFRFSKLSRTIDGLENSIQNNLTNISMKYQLFPNLYSQTKYTIKFHNALDIGVSLKDDSTLNSTSFTYLNQTCYFGDDGLGTVYIYKLVDNARSIVAPSVGSIDYNTGEVILNAFVPQALPSGKETIDLLTQPKNNDIIPVRNQILSILDTDIAVTMFDETTGIQY